VYLPLCNHRIWAKSFPLVVFSRHQGRGVARGQPCQNPLSLPPSSITPATIDPNAAAPPCRNPSTSPTLQRPCTRPWASQQGQHATVHLLPCHLAARLATTRRVNSPKQNATSPTVHRAPTVPARRQRAARSGQSGHSVPACTRAHPRRPAPEPTWHGTPKPTPPLPRSLEPMRDPAEPENDQTPTETDRFPTGPGCH
jgi:hypothetical protein